MLKGIIDLNGKEVEVAISIKGKSICLHLPKDVDTTNWYHSVYVSTDLEQV